MRAGSGGARTAASAALAGAVLAGAVLAGAVSIAGCSEPGDSDDGRVEAWLAALSLEEKVSLMHGKNFYPGDLTSVAGVARLGIPEMWATDGSRGVVAGGANTAFPVVALRAATWDPELERRVGEVMGLEAQARGANILLAPTLNVLRHPRWGRAQETYGEDPLLIGVMGAAFIRGVQATVMACAKHFAVNSIEDTRLEVDVSVDERSLREVYLAPFRRAVRDAGVATVMAAYNAVNGSYATENPYLLSDVLVGDWQFDGFVMSDWVFAMHSTVAAARAGLHLEMPFAEFYGAPLVDAVRRDEVAEDAIDDAVRRMLRKRLEFGLDEPAPLDPDAVATQAHRELAREVAERGMVLLANRNRSLPLDGVRSLAVVGRLAAVANLGDGGSSDVTPPEVVTPLAGLQARAGATDVFHVDRDALEDADESAIAGADAAVVVVGFTGADEGEAMFEGSGGDRDSLALGAQHAALVERVAALNERTIVVLEAGSAVQHGAWIDAADALVLAWYPGMEGGTALARLLFGDAGFSGRLPVAFPRSELDLPLFDNRSLEVRYGALHGQRWLDGEQVAALFPFGYGLDYTEIEYRSVALERAELGPDQTLVARVEVANVGDRAGDEVVQLYLGYAGSSVARPVKELRAFRRVRLEPGETATIALEVPMSELAYFDTESASWVGESLELDVRVGPNAADLPLRAAASVRAR